MNKIVREDWPAILALAFLLWLLCMAVSATPCTQIKLDGGTWSRPEGIVAQGAQSGFNGYVGVYAISAGQWGPALINTETCRGWWDIVSTTETPGAGRLPAVAADMHGCCIALKIVGSELWVNAASSLGGSAIYPYIAAWATQHAKAKPPNTAVYRISDGMPFLRFESDEDSGYWPASQPYVGTVQKADPNGYTWKSAIANSRNPGRQNWTFDVLALRSDASGPTTIPPTYTPTGRPIASPSATKREKTATPAPSGTVCFTSEGTCYDCAHPERGFIPCSANTNTAIKTASPPPVPIATAVLSPKALTPPLLLATASPAAAGAAPSASPTAGALLPISNGTPTPGAPISTSPTGSTAVGMLAGLAALAIGSVIALLSKIKAWLGKRK